MCKSQFFFIRLLIICNMGLLLISCSGVSVQDYAGMQPAMTPEVFFNGQLTAHGIVKNRSGKVIRYFNADLKGYWKDGLGTLEEDFIFNNGEKQRRVWKFTNNGEGSYSGTAGDVIGTALGKAAGNSFFWQYVLRIPYDDGTIDLKIDDRMYLVQSDIMINESVMRKFGFKVGEIVLVIRKKTPGSDSLGR